MTPPEYSAIRPYLELEQRLPELAVPVHRVHDGQQERRACSSRTRTAPSGRPWCEQALHAPSLYDESLRLLARRGSARARRAGSNATGRSRTRRDAQVEQAWLVVYRNPSAQWDLYQLGEELVDLEDAFRLWRFRHVTTVERMIGFKRGTGGTSGVAYLRKMLDVTLFPELWRIRTEL